MIAATLPPLVYGDGRAVDPAKVVSIEPSTAGRYTVNTGRHACHKCGGAGGYAGWPGYTCFRCNGSGREDYPEIVTAYDPTAFAKLEASRQRKADKEAQKKLDVIAAWEKANPGLLADVEKFAPDNDFLRDMLHLIRSGKGLSERQEAAIRPAIERSKARAKEQAARAKVRAKHAASSRHLGEVGGSLRAVGTIEFAKDVVVQDSFNRSSRYGSEKTLRKLSIRTRDGACITVFGSGKSLWDFDTGAQVIVEGTIKKHDEWQGEAQTALTRASLSAAPTARETKRIVDTFTPPSTPALARAERKREPKPKPEPDCFLCNSRPAHFSVQASAYVCDACEAVHYPPPPPPPPVVCACCGVEIERFREPQFCDACKATLGPLVTVEKVATWKLDGTMMYLPIRPYGVIDAINRVALATGGVRGAMAGSHADYNGHSTQVSFNDRRQYWVAEYTWAGRNVLARGEFESCVQAAKHEWDRGALGAAAQVKCLMDVQVEYCRSLGFVSQEEYDAANASWRNEYLDRVAAALRMDKLGFKEGGTADLIAEAKAAGVLLSAGR